MDRQYAIYEYLAKLFLAWEAKSGIQFYWLASQGYSNRTRWRWRHIWWEFTLLSHVQEQNYFSGLFPSTPPHPHPTRNSHVMDPLNVFTKHSPACSGATYVAVSVCSEGAFPVFNGLTYISVQRELVNVVWWRSWSCSMSLADAQLSKFRNAQLVAFIGSINTH